MNLDKLNNLIELFSHQVEKQNFESYFCTDGEDNQPFIIGGGEIYSQSIDLADRIELTRVHTNVDGDAFFPEINYKIWKELSRDERFKDEKHLYDFTFIRYEKK